DGRFQPGRPPDDGRMADRRRACALQRGPPGPPDVLSRSAGAPIRRAASRTRTSVALATEELFAAGSLAALALVHRLHARDGNLVTAGDKIVGEHLRSRHV